jgi:hypothetical protein
MEKTPGRIEAARGRATAVKQALVAVSVGLFAAVLVGARASHPGEPAAAQNSGAAVQEQGDSAFQDFGFGSSNVGPATGAGASGSTHAS